MHKAIRHQADDMGDVYSDGTAQDFSAGDTTRQEFKDDADINILLRRYGVGPQPQKQVTYGDIDTDGNLQDAYNAMDAARQAYHGMPREVRERYGNWMAMLGAIERGELVKAPPPEPSPKEDKETPPA